MDKAKYTLEVIMKPEEIETEDGGQARIFTCSDDDYANTGMFVRVCSWDETREHSDLNKFIGKKIKITIEEI